MARPKSESKHQSILEAATAIFAERGVWSTPTSAISSAAGIAEGTLFTYFKSKDELVNALYRELKFEMAKELMAEFPLEGSVYEKLKHIWNCYVAWGSKNPTKLKVLGQLKVSEKISCESMMAGSQPFAEIEKLARESIEKKILRDYPFAYVGEIMGNLAETTILAMQREDTNFDYCAAGFEIFWKGISTGSGIET